MKNIPIIKDVKDTKERWRLCKEHKICYLCGEPAIENNSYCKLHLEKKRKANLKRRSKVCDGCGGPKEIGGYCKICWDKKQNRRKEREKLKAQRGECKFCSNQSLPDKNICNFCVEKNNLKNIYRIENKLCLQCGKDNNGNLSHRCTLCQVRIISVSNFGNVKKANELIALMESQNNICPYTGNLLIIGDNASLDHKIPKSRGGGDEVSNLQWVYNSDKLNVNWMKGDLTHDEFLIAIQSISQYLILTKGH